MASRKDEKERKRQERLSQQQREELEAKRRRTYGMVAGTVLVLGVIAAVIFIVVGSGGDDSGSAEPAAKPTAQFSGAATPPAQQRSDLFAAAKNAGCVLKNPPIEGREHVSSSKPLKYGTNPPTSGNHDALAQPDGVYGVYPQPRHMMHALEGGRVEIQYKPSIPQKRIDQLGGLYNDDSLYLLLYPNPTMSYDVAVAAWGHLAGCKKIGDGTYDVIRAFIQRYRDQGPEPAASHQATAGQPGWPGPVPPPHEDGNISGS